MIDFAAWEPGETLAETVAKRDEAWAGQCFCDYAYHLMLRDRIPPERLEELGRFIDAGYPTVKIFTTDITPSRRGRMIRFGDIWEIFKVIAAHGGLGVIHAEDDDIVMHMYDKLIAENRAEFENMAEVHNVELHESDYTPWEGQEVSAWPVVTVLRGSVGNAEPCGECRGPDGHRALRPSQRGPGAGQTIRRPCRPDQGRAGGRPPHASRKRPPVSVPPRAR